ncbi:glycosyl transferase family protein [Salmonella enterica subsp. arizonae]|uniref:Glycosyl transferase family protein n=1 Tax=Salmonella enterica subsp. arizonae TaxID=59203 RepID=A0A379T0U7_SALER|nr:glycosyl transferase family protein [Salmonella enterica subsp. arizonae]
MALRIKGESEAEMRGFYDAMQHPYLPFDAACG